MDQWAVPSNFDFHQSSDLDGVASGADNQFVPTATAASIDHFWSQSGAICSGQLLPTGKPQSRRSQDLQSTTTSSSTTGVGPPQQMSPVRQWLSTAPMLTLLLLWMLQGMKGTFPLYLWCYIALLMSYMFIHRRLDGKQRKTTLWGPLEWLQSPCETNGQSVGSHKCDVGNWSPAGTKQTS